MDGAAELWLLRRRQRKGNAFLQDENNLSSLSVF